MRNQLLLAAVAALGLASPALAQPGGDAVNVSIGTALQQKAHDYGVRDLQDISRQLHDVVGRAVTRAGPAAPVRVDLVIEDAIPNRPTFDQLGRTSGLSLNSIGVGGARVSGVAIYADGTQRPFRQQFFETNLRDERGATTWSDADRAFDQVASDISRGKFSTAYAGPGPSGSGHFGQPYDGR